MLVTPYDRLTNEAELQKLKQYSQTITHSKLDKMNLHSEEYMHFYTFKDIDILLGISTKTLIVNLVKNDVKINLLTLPIYLVPNVGVNGKDNKMFIKYYLQWEKKHQISFYDDYDYRHFNNELKKLFDRSFYGKEYFVKNMNDLSGNISITVCESSMVETVIELKKEYFKIVEPTKDKTKKSKKSY
ncbi:hypothetical protein BDAP_002117 [Binucleata daphniae]